MAILEVRTAPKCASGSAFVRRIALFESCEWTDQIQGNRGSGKLVLPADATADVAACAILNVLRITDDDGSVYEYRIVGLTDGPMKETVEVELADLSQDLQRVRLYTSSGGVQKHGISGTMTPSQWISTYVLPALSAAGLTWVVAGTITPTQQVSLSFTRQTPLAVLTALEAATKLEFWLARNGDTNYQIMLGTRTASGTPAAWVGRNVETLERHILVDNRFATRVAPYGATVGTETEPTHAGQHGWKASVVSGATLTLAHPQAGGANPIAADSQLNNLVAGLSFDAVYAPDGIAATNPAGIAYDPTRRTIWWSYQKNVATVTAWYLGWYCLADNTRGSVTVTGSATLGEVVYDGTRDEILVACSDTGNVGRVNPSTKAFIANVSVGGTPTTLTNLRGQGIAQLAVGFSSATGVKLVNLSTLAIDATLSTTTTANMHVAYESGSTRYFCFGQGSAVVEYYSAAYAALGSVSPFANGVQQAAITGGVIYVVEATAAPHIRAITAATAAMGTSTSLAQVGGANLDFSGPTPYAIAPVLGGNCYFTSSNAPLYVVVVNPSGFAITASQRAPGAVATYDSTDDVFITNVRNTGAAVLYRNGGTLPSGRLRATVQTTTLSSQQITIPGGTKGPIYAGQIVEFRADTSDSYQHTISDPVTLAAYGPVEGYVGLNDQYKRNYRRDPQAAEWASSRPDWFGITVPRDPGTWSSVGQPKWVTADAQASSVTTSGLIDTLQTTGTAGTAWSLKVKGFAAGRVFQVGDIIIATGNQLVNLTRVVADGSGKATLTVTEVAGLSGGGSLADGSAVTVSSPTQANNTIGAQMLVLPQFGDSNNAICAFATHLPAISGATQAWLRLRLVYLGAGRDISNLSFAIAGAGNSATLTPGSQVVGGTSAPAVLEFVLEQQLSITAEDFITVTQSADAGNNAGSGYGVLYVKAVELYIATAASCPSPFGATPGDELVPWTSANALLLTQGRSTPTIDYTVQPIEDGAVWKVGQTCTLRDPALGIAASPRVVLVTRNINRRSDDVSRPIVQLNTRSLSAMEGLAAVGS